MRFVLSIRTLSIALTIATVLLGGRAYQVDYRNRTIRKIESLGGEFLFLEHRKTKGIRDLVEIKSPKWLILKGADRQHVKCVLQELRFLPEIFEVHLTSCELGEGDLTPLTEILSLKNLSLSGSSGVRENIESVTAISTLKKLDLQSTKISDRDLKCIAKLSSIKSLDISYCPVTDGGISHLKGHENLLELKAEGTKITELAIADLCNCCSRLVRIEFHEIDVTQEEKLRKLGEKLEQEGYVGQE